MKRRWATRGGALGVACAVLGTVAAPAVGQLEGKTALVLMFRGNITRNAAIALDMEVTWRTNEAGFLEDLRNGTWDLVALDLAGREVVEKATMLSLFEEHLARRGRLMVNYPELDQWPELQQLLGVEVLRDRSEPEDVFAPLPGNPIWAEVIGAFSDEWPDNGDDLRPIAGNFDAARFANRTGPVATVVRSDDAALCNGFDWDSMSSGGAIFLAKAEIVYLMGCRPDLEADGRLDILDFLAFQNLWATHSFRANTDFDSDFTIFDFLEFQNDFAAGCK